MNARDFLILFALTESARHGYGIVKDVETQSGGTVRMDPSNLYRSLKRLIKDGLVAESASVPVDEEERRRFYSLTPLGAQVVRAEAERLDALATAARERLVISNASRTV